MLNIHILTAGANVDKGIQRITRFYPVEKYVIITEENPPDDVQMSIEKVIEVCHSALDIPLDVIPYKKGDLNDLMEKIIEIRKNYPEAKLYFNITFGRKDFAIMTFMGALWLDGIGYYLPKEFEKPLEFPTPKMPMNTLSKNKLYQQILRELVGNTNQRINQSILKNRISKNPNNNKTLSSQVLSQAIGVLEEASLVNKEVNGRETIISITLAGRIAYSMLP
ncbi:hypothetical protein L1994_03370 [Methanomicrobium antiquum]|uniref:Uncharacterized protein n=1 Tax=Methanomicrobium antiquum TaxID=487686 RepID=A0AAF0FNA1_9EURY|nr:hypothetical protein [Methanomicrobium antiquum]MDD4127488.1 hypothetical protein [Methanomicrobium sp.]WFN37443.1 hypothetical protein L1994_03370 [Methanomicrobium antiquum]